MTHHYWRVAISAPEDAERMLAESMLYTDPGLYQKLRRGHRILLSCWLPDEQIGRVIAVGVVLSTNSRDVVAHMNWRPSDTTLRPNPAGRRFWSDRPYFRFANTVVARYMLDDLFEEHFWPGPIPEPHQASRHHNRVSSMRTSGFVYVLRSPYGYKIGKTIHLKTRLQMFGVKLPFPNSVEHCAWFEDYSSAERQFHAQFADKRLEGEWFNLSQADLEIIRNFGSRVDHQAL